MLEQDFIPLTIQKKILIKSWINKKVIGKFKDEASGKQITYFVVLRAKLKITKLKMMM